MAYSRRDLVWALDPFKSTGSPRSWLIIADETMPFLGDLLAVACTWSEYPSLNRKLEPRHFESGNKPDQTTYCSPWLLATIKPGLIRNKQGTLTDSFTETIARDSKSFIDTGTDASM